MAHLKYRADTDIDVQRDINYSSMPIYGSVGLENIFMVNILWQGLVLYRGHPIR